MQRIIGVTGVVLLLAAAGALLGWYTYPWNNINSDFLFRLMAPSSGPGLTTIEKQVALTAVLDAIESVGQPSAPGDAPLDVPEVLTQRDVRPVWVTLTLPGLGASRGQAQEGSLYRSLRTAARRALQQAKPGSSWLERRRDVSIQIDLLQSRGLLFSRHAAYLDFALEPGIDGLHLLRGGQEHTQLPADAVTRGLLTPRSGSRRASYTTLLEQASLDLGLDAHAWREDAALEIWRIRTQSFGAPLPGKGLRDFYRGNVLRAQRPPTAREIYAAIHAGGSWLLENTRNDGTFVYEYLPNEDRVPNTYNVVRHAGTLFGLLELYRTFGDGRFLEGARRGMPALTRNLRAPGDEPELLALADGTRFPTGGSALALLTLLDAPLVLRDDDHRRQVESLAAFLVRMIDERGAVFPDFQAARDSSRVQAEPRYYPGETLLALARLQGAAPHPDRLAAAERLASRLMLRARAGLQADPWVIQGLTELFFRTGTRAYAESALFMARTLLDDQYPPNTPPFPDYFGAWRQETRTPRSSRVGSRSEALTAAARAARALDEPAEDLEERLLYAAHHLLEQQFRPENSFFLPAPHKVLGGFRAGLVDNHLRIDFNQHACVGLIGALEAALRRERLQPWWMEQPIPPL